MLVPPARVAHQRFGSLTAMAEAAGVGRRTVIDWLATPRRTSSGKICGAGGELPNTAVIRRMLDAAKRAGIALTEHELIYGSESTAIQTGTIGNQPSA